MKLLQTAFAVALVLAAPSAQGGQPAGSPPPAGQPSGRGAGNSTHDERAMFRFAPMWMPVSRFPPSPHFPPASKVEVALPVPSHVYAEIWQARWQEELGLSAKQKEKLVAIKAQAEAEAKDHAERFKRLSPEERKAQAGESAAWAKRRDSDLARQIEAALTPQQLQTLKDFLFPMQAVGLLYDARVRREIVFTTEQEQGFRRLAKQHLARFQEVNIERAEKLWNLLTPAQQAELPEVVKRQGPTSAVLSLAWELGFDLDSLLPHYPMLAEAPVRRRLGLNADQEKQLLALMAESAAREEKARQERSQGKEQPSKSIWGADADMNRRVEAILTPQQLAALNEIDFRRRVALALSYSEKRKAVDVTAPQDAEFQRLDEETHQRLYRIDREMLGQALEILTPSQRQRLREEIDRAR